MEQEIILQQDTTGHINRLTKRFLLLLNDIPLFQIHLTSMVKSINKFFRQPNHHTLTLTCTIDDIYEELYDTKIDLTLTTKSSTQMFHSPKPSTPHIRSGRMQKSDMKHPHSTLADHNSHRSAYPPRSDNSPLTCEACGLTQRELHQLLRHIHTKDPKECCLRGPSFIKHKDVCERVNQYNLKHKTDTKVSYDTSLSKRPPKHASIPPPSANLTTFEDIIENNNDFELTDDDIDELLLEDVVSSDVDNDESLTTPTVSALTVPQISHLNYTRTVLHPPHSRSSSFQSSHDDLTDIHTFYERRDWINTLPLNSYKNIALTVLCHLDGGANAFIFPNRDHFWAYNLTDTAIRQVGGSCIPSIGMGIVIIRLNNELVIPLYPCYHIPDNQQITFSPNALKKFNHFKSARIESLA